jgi:hypothetical protein
MPAPTIRLTGLLALAALPLLAACGGGDMTPPSAASVAGMPVLGQVKITENFAGGQIKGDGEFAYGGVIYRFKITGKVLSGDTGAVNIVAEGDVYGMSRLQNFTGRYVQGRGGRNPEGSGANDLWLRNQSDVVLHVWTRDPTAMRSIGIDEIYIPQVQ